MRLASAFICLLSLFAETVPAQQQVPIRYSDLPHITREEAIDRALKQSTLTGDGSPFHVVLDISEPRTGNPKYTATIEIYWANANRYRVTIKSPAFSETRIVNRDQVEEHASGDFYPSWLRNFVTALLNPLPRYKDFLKDVLAKPASEVIGSRVFYPCIQRNDMTNGITDEMTRAEICLDYQQHIILSADFTYSMRFNDYDQFEKKSIARTYQTKSPEQTDLVGRIRTLEPWKHIDSRILKINAPTPRDQQFNTSFVSSATNEALLESAPTIDWPSIPQGKVDGHMIIHIVTDRTGRVREASPFSSDQSIVDLVGLRESLNYKFKPLIVDGAAQQMETPLVIHYVSRIENPYPVVSGADIEKYASGCGYNPVLPANLFPSGMTFKHRITIGDDGFVKQHEDSQPALTEQQLRQTGFDERGCKFEQYLVNGNRSYYHIDFVFTAP